MRRTRDILQYMLLLMATMLLLLILNITVLGVIMVTTQNDRASSTVLAAIGEELTRTDGGIAMREEGLREIDDVDGFAFLIGDDGAVTWEYQMPAELPRQYTIRDVASFTRWYLEDYPVNTWETPYGLFVLGLPAGSLWKYTLTAELPRVQVELRILPWVLLLDLVIVILLPYVLMRRWNRRQENARTAWIADVSHDIRTPLSLAILHTEQIADGAENPAQKAGQTLVQLLRLRELALNLNVINRLEYGYGSGRRVRENIAVAAQLRETLCGIMNQDQEDRYTLVCDIAPELEDYTLQADQGLFIRMMENLIGNSIRHNPEGCTITVQLQRETVPEVDGIRGVARRLTRRLLRRDMQRDVVLTIRDDGVGMSQEELDQLLRQQSELHDRGLGLHLVQLTARTYGWEVTFQSAPAVGFCSRIVF